MAQPAATENLFLNLDGNGLWRGWGLETGGFALSDLHEFTAAIYPPVFLDTPSTQTRLPSDSDSQPYLFRTCEMNCSVCYNIVRTWTLQNSPSPVRHNRKTWVLCLVIWEQAQSFVVPSPNIRPVPSEFKVDHGRWNWLLNYPLDE